VSLYWLSVWYNKSKEISWKSLSNWKIRRKKWKWMDWLSRAEELVGWKPIIERTNLICCADCINSVSAEKHHPCRSQLLILAWLNYAEPIDFFFALAAAVRMKHLLHCPIDFCSSSLSLFILRLGQEDFSKSFINDIGIANSSVYRFIKQEMKAREIRNPQSKWDQQNTNQMSHRKPISESLNPFLGWDLDHT